MEGERSSVTEAGRWWLLVVPLLVESALLEEVLACLSLSPDERGDGGRERASEK